MGGGGAGAGGVENRVTIMQGDDDSQNGIVTAGIKQLYQSGMSVYGVGDIGVIYHQNYVHGGMAYGSDQGTQNFIDLEENAVMVHGTVNAGSSNRQISATQTTNCHELDSYLCVPSPGSWVIDTTTPVASGKGLSVSFTGTGWNTLASVTTDQTTIPATSVYGVSTTPISPASNGYDDPKSTNIVLASGVGSFAVGDPVCVLGDAGSGYNFEEQSVLTAVSGSAGTQTLTLPLALPQQGPAVFKGYCMYLSFDADLAQGIRYALPAVSLDGTHILYGYPVTSNLTAGPLPNAGTTYGVFNGGASSGWHLYYGARVWKVDTNSPTYQPLAFNNILTYVEPNGVFAPGDTLEAIEFPAQKVDGLDLYSSMDMAGLSSNSNTTLQLHMLGKGNNSTAAILHAYNQQDTSTYTPFGGPMSEPTFMTTAGVFDLFSSNQYTPLDYAFLFQQHQPGQTQYYVWSDPWGQLRIDNTQTWQFDNSSINVQGGGTFGGGVQGAGFIAGKPGVSSGTFGVQFNFGNGTSPSVYIAPEYAIGTVNNHLAVTTQAQSRTPVPGDDYAAPDGTLDAGALTGGTVSATNSDIYGTYNCAINNSTNGGKWCLESLGSAWAAYGKTHAFGLFNQDSNQPSFVFMDNLLGVNSAAAIAWTSGTNTGLTNPDTGLSRESAGVVDVGNGTAGDASGTLNAAIVSASTLLRTASYTVSGLPSASSAGAGAIVRVSDAASYTAGACTGGGTDTVLAISDGTGWTCH